MSNITTQASATVNTGGVFSAITVIALGSPVIVVGDAVGAHPAAPFGVGYHSGAMAVGSPTVRVNGIAVCRNGDLCSCGHVISGGQPTIQVS